MKTPTRWLRELPDCGAEVGRCRNCDGDPPVRDGLCAECVDRSWLQRVEDRYDSGNGHGRWWISTRGIWELSAAFTPLQWSIGLNAQWIGAGFWNAWIQCGPWSLGVYRTDRG